MDSDSLSQLRTPCLVLDRDRLQHNIDRMNRRMEELGVGLRPHVKTAKSREVARMGFSGRVGPITVSTLKEAEYFIEDGFTDVLYAVGIAPDKLQDVADLRSRGADLLVILDHPAMATAVAERAGELGHTFPVLIEVDTDGNRAGLSPDDPRIVETGRILASSPHTELRGVMTHAGNSYECESVEAIRAFAERERSGAVTAAESLHSAGLPCPMVSVGSTPTASFAENLEGVTEVRAGVFVFQDLYQAGLGVCSVDEIAVSVLATVISHRPELGWVIVDAGGLALSKDRSTASQAVDQGYGLVCDLAGRPLADIIVDRANQEHGMVISRTGEPLHKRLPLGSRVRILPNHSCMTAAAYEGYAVVDHEGRVVDCWSRVNGW